ncbi:ORF103 [Leucania separata nucleopolyhedrovirus]|uniref:ORF103 n=1 Tax=Leucania separata nucleopolyhedrovirus TaxID=1307956 RepID=Q0IL16_NPVLS|nr:ORF103 [Leucania separata nucleopolyhedrovirus]AAR28867.1 ORF103 [Leucania separata nucleopolyhedrovirus]
MARIDEIKGFILDVARIVFDEKHYKVLVLIVVAELLKDQVQIVAMELWCCLKRRFPLYRGHILVVDRFQDTRMLSIRHLENFEYILFKFVPDSSIDTQKYAMNLFKCADSMPDIRFYIKNTCKISYLGHVYVIGLRYPMYGFLKEWYVQDCFEMDTEPGVERLLIEPPHVLVFDLDSTLITDEQNVNIRDEFVYDSLEYFKKIGCVLILWSYGSERHVSESMYRTRLDKNLFHKIICGGYRTTSNPSRDVRFDRTNNKTYIDKPFRSDVEPVKGRLPKSPRIILYYLKKLGVNYTKTITLVDDLKTNNYSYDLFVNVQRSPVPRNDWKMYHDIIVKHIDGHRKQFESI